MEIIKKIEEVEVKGIKLKVELSYYYDKDNDLTYDDVTLGNKNLAIIRNDYRRVTGLLTDTEIKKIREVYNLNQRNFSLLLGFGEVTITRYESKMIQDSAHDAVIRSATDPNKFMEYVKRNANLYLKYNSLESYSNLIMLIEEKIRGSLSLSGNIRYDENKFLAVIKYTNSLIKNLTKTKLAKFLWYIDFKSFKESNFSIVGLTYIHNFYGAYPIGYNDKLSNNNIKIEEKYFSSTDEPIYYKKSSKSSIDLNEYEKNIINIVVEKFKDYNAKELVEYMHNEDAYKKTKQNEIIKYDFAKTLSI